MKLDTLEIARLLPSFMRNDENFKAIIYAIEPEFKSLYLNTELIRLYQNIDSISENILDEMAIQFSVSEYNTSYDVSVKRKLIKNCLSVHRKRGTVASVIEVCEKIFGDATIEEWFEYDGEPYHFKVYTENLNVSDEMISDFRRVVDETKNARSHLDELVVSAMNSVDLIVGFHLHMSDDSTLYTEDYITSEELLIIRDGVLMYNDSDEAEPVTLYDIDTGEIYQIVYDETADGIHLLNIGYDTTGIIAEEYKQLTDTVTDEEYKVFIKSGELFYEKIS